MQEPVVVTPNPQNETNPDAVIVCLATAPSLDVAERIGRELVQQQLAACVSFVPGARSVYRWKGDVCVDEEVWMMIKTLASAWESLQAAYRALHPYETPELLALSVTDGLLPYLDWVRASVSAGGAA